MLPKLIIIHHLCGYYYSPSTVPSIFQSIITFFWCTIDFEINWSFSCKIIQREWMNFKLWLKNNIFCLVLLRCSWIYGHYFLWSLVGILPFANNSFNESWDTLPVLLFEKQWKLQRKTMIRRFRMWYLSVELCFALSIFKSIILKVSGDNI